MRLPELPLESKVLVGGFYRPGTHFPLGTTQSHVLTQLQVRLGNGSTCVQEQKLVEKTHGLWQELVGFGKN